MQDIKSTTEKNAPASRAISMAMQIWRYRAERITQYGRSRRATQMPLDAAIRQVFAPYRPGGRHALKMHETDPLLSSSKQQAA